MSLPGWVFISARTNRFRYLRYDYMHTLIAIGPCNREFIRFFFLCIVGQRIRALCCDELTSTDGVISIALSEGRLISSCGEGGVKMFAMR